MPKEYNINKYKNPLFTVDSVLFTVEEGVLKVLLVKRANEPFLERWGLPGGFVDVDVDVSTEETAKRKLKEKTSVAPSYLEQLGSFSGPKRDPRGFSVTLAYYALIAAQEVASHIDTVEDVRWVAFAEVEKMELAFDHKEIIAQGKQRLQQKALYSMVPVHCLPELFTIGQLKTVIETILGKSIQRKSLIRRIESSEMFIALEEKVKSGGRFAQQYRVKEGIDLVTFERNLSM